MKDDINLLIIRMKNNENWTEEFNENILKKLIIFLSNIKDSLKIEIEEWDNIQFKYCDLMKKLFFLHLSDFWEYKPSSKTIFNALKSVEYSEVKNNKCVIEFTKEEIKQSATDLMKGMQYYRLRQRINIISKFQIFYEEEVEIHSNWREIFIPSKLEKTIGRDINSSDLIDIDDLINLFKRMDNIQESIIPILIFNGVKLSKSNEKDEIRFLKKSDLTDNLLKIKSKDRTKDRVVRLDSEISEMFRETSSQDYVTQEKRGENVELELKDTDYILRASLPARAKSTDEDEDILSFRGAWGRLLKCRKQMESLAPEFSFSAKKIEQSGKIYYINKFMEEEDMELYDAIRATLKRFGDWRYLEDENEKSYPPNTQMVNRLKHLWSFYN